MTQQNMTLQDIIIDIHALNEDLRAYERKYGVLSETFYASYINGEEPQHDFWTLDWADWAGAYKILLRRYEQYRHTIQALREQTPTLVNVIEKNLQREPIPINYPEIIKWILREYAVYYSAENENPLRAMFDDEQQSYLLLDTGWYEDEYVHNTPIHIDIIDDKIWIQCDDTEQGVATDLLEAGVPHTDIVLGFRHPEVRPHTEFAVG